MINCLTKISLTGMLMYTCFQSYRRCYTLNWNLKNADGCFHPYLMCQVSPTTPTNYITASTLMPQVLVSLLSDRGYLTLAWICVLSKADRLRSFEPGVRSHDKVLFWPQSGKPAVRIHCKNVSSSDQSVFQNVWCIFV